MSTNVRAVHLPGAAALEWLRQQALAALTTWAREWLSGWKPNDARISTLRVSGVGGLIHPLFDEYAAVRAQSGALFFRRSAADRSNFGRAILGEELLSPSWVADEWVADTAEEAWSARNHALCVALLGSPIEPRSSINELPASLFALGSGAVCLSCEPLGLYAIADNSVWRAAPPFKRSGERRLSPVVPLSEATRGGRLKIEAIVGSVEVEVPTLMDLRRGDVLRLSGRLADGIAVLCERKPLAAAALGETQGRKAVQLLAAHQPIPPGETQ